jgi:DNA-binding CsgD family transcriptional regulator
MVARVAVAGAVAGVDGHPDVWLRELGWAFAAGLRAEADLAAVARDQRSEARLREARQIGAGLLAQMRAVFEDVAARRVYDAPQSAAWLATCEAEFTRLEDAPDPDRWADAAAAWDRLRVPYQVGYARMREAEAALGLQRDRPRAARRLTDAHGIARRLGALPLLQAIELLAIRGRITIERVAAHSDKEMDEALDQDDGGRYSAQEEQLSGGLPRGRHDLTPREREVLELLAAGRSDGEIGDALFISKKTVSVHVATIKGKLGARSRVEMATDAIAFGIIDAPQRDRK